MSSMPLTLEPAERVPGVPTRRGAELMLLLLAIALPLAAWAYVEVVLRQQIPANLITYGVAFAGVFLLAHVVVRRFAPYADPLILPVVALLNGLGLVMIHRIDLDALARATAAGRDMPVVLAPGQMQWLGLSIGLLMIVLVLLRDHRVLQRFTYTSMVIGLVLLVLPLVPGIGHEKYGAKIWVNLGFTKAQPAEAVKIVLLIFFAGYLVTAKDSLQLAGRRVLGVDLPRGRDLGPLLAAWGIGLAILVLQRDLGTSLLFFGTFVCLLYVATERRSWVILGLLLVVAGGFAAYPLFGHVRKRVDNWIDPFADPNGRGHQLVQSLYSFANGGLTGTGLGSGSPALVPVKYTDFIVAVFGEELGLAGLTALLLLYAILIERGLRTALLARDPFGTLLATGLSVMFALQLFVTIGGITRLIPSTGLTTPFLSAGGSSLVANYVLVALLLRISDAARRPQTPPSGFAVADNFAAGVARPEEPEPAR